MRMWMVDPKLLCRNHLLGAHGELHKFKHSFVKQHKMGGYRRLIFPRYMQQRHDELAAEMVRRGYNHKSQYEQPDVEYLPVDMLNDDPSDYIEFNLNDLTNRCQECKQRIEGDTQ